MNLFSQWEFDSASETPIYRQLAENIRGAILSGALAGGDRLPATRELAGQLGLNRTTISAAYAVLEEAGLLEGAVGRGSFVAAHKKAPKAAFDWDSVLKPSEPAPVPPPLEAAINFASSRPAADCFPLDAFRRAAQDVIESPQAAGILQLGSPFGYPPLRRYLLAEASAQGAVRSNDDLMMTSGCQQALDLIARVLVEENTPVLLEDPVYHGLLRIFGRARAQILPAPVGDTGLNIAVVESLAEQHRPRLLVVMPDFQNPTGTTLALDARKALLAVAKRFGIVLVEIGIYRDLRYRGAPLPTLKQMDDSGNVIAIGSYSKIAFPGLRVGWISGPRPVIARLAEAKQTSDLHSDQLSQAVLLRFAQSKDLSRHLHDTRRDGAQRLSAALDACGRSFPPGTRFTRPEGGMNLWVELPAPLETEQLLKAASEQGVSFLPGSYFSAGHRGYGRSLRLSFGGLSPAEIERGITILGTIALEQLERFERMPLDSMMAIV